MLQYGCTYIYVRMDVVQLSLEMNKVISFKEV